MADITPDDLRASVAAGHLNEAQAASVLTLAQQRAGYRDTMPAEDEPFELFRGFAEIFVTIGLSILLFAAFGLLMLANSGPLMLLILGLCIPMAEYFTRRRRMVLPSILLTCAAASAIWAASSGVMLTMQTGKDPSSTQFLLAMILTAVALLFWFHRYRVPFTMFLVGLCGLGAIITVTHTLRPVATWHSVQHVLDLNNSTGFGPAMLLFGLLALAGGIWFDTRDPYRLGRLSASGFWLHVLAAAALVNTVAITFFQMGPGLGYGMLALALFCATLLALVIDRRSFLTAGLGYMIFLLFWAFTDKEVPGSWLTVLLFLGIVLTALGAGWTQLRTRLMSALPNFPGKGRLPPYGTAQ